MAVHNDLPPMAREATEEYLAIAHHCITTRKSNGGVYGYPAVLLLFSIVDALSNYAGYPEHTFGAMKDIFPRCMVSALAGPPGDHHARNHAVS